LIWTDDMTKRLKQLWAEGYSASQCAEMLGGGVTRPAVLAKCDRLRKMGDPTAPARRDGDVGKARTSLERSAQSTARLAARRKAEKKPQPNWDAMRSRPVPVEPYVEKGDDGVTPRSKQIRLLDLEKHHCRWPIGDPRAGSFRFCGCNKVPGLVYCETHARRAYPVRYPTETSPYGIAATGGVSASGGDLRRGGGVANPQPAEGSPGRSERETEDA